MISMHAFVSRTNRVTEPFASRPCRARFADVRDGGPRRAAPRARPGAGMVVAAFFRLELPLRRLARSARRVLVDLALLLAQGATVLAQGATAYGPALIALITRPRPRHVSHSRPSTRPLPAQPGHRSSPVPGVPGGASSPGAIVLSGGGWPPVLFR